MSTFDVLWHKCHQSVWIAILVDDQQIHSIARINNTRKTDVAVFIGLNSARGTRTN